MACLFIPGVVWNDDDDDNNNNNNNNNNNAFWTLLKNLQKRQDELESRERIKTL